MCLYCSDFCQLGSYAPEGCMLVVVSRGVDDGGEMQVMCRLTIG
jgi:hypothetical protein